MIIKMHPESLSTSITSLKENIKNISAETLKDSIFMQYQRKIANDLRKILENKNSENMTKKALERYLHENWKRVRGSAFCYTATHRLEATDLLCQVAIYVAQNQLKGEKAISPLEALMPGLHTDSLSDNYPHLGSYEQIRLIKQDNPESKNKPSYTTDTEWVTPDTNIGEVLRTHILGTNQTWLIPINVLTNIALDNNTPIDSPYINDKLPSNKLNQGHITDDERSRLWSYAKETRELKEALDEYQRLSSDDSSLLGQLITLSNKLRFNSVSLIGQEKTAGQGVYPALIEFNRYYEQLAQEDKNHIPTAVKEEIELLLSLSGDPKQNINATANMNTCIATRRTELNKAMHGKEQRLDEIRIGKEQKDNLIGNAIKNIESCKLTFKQAIEQKTIEGADSLPLNEKVLDWMNFEIRIDSKKDLEDIATLSAHEIKTCCNSDEIKNQIVKQFESLEDWIMFAIDTKVDRFEAFMDLIAEPLSTKLLKNTKDISILLMTLDLDRFNLLFNKIPIGQFIKDAGRFRAFFENLNPEQRTVVFNAFKTQLPDIILTNWSVWDFNKIFRNLTPEQREILFRSVKDQLPNIHSYNWDYFTFSSFLRILTNEQGMFVINVFKDQLPDIIKTPQDFNGTVRHLTTEQRAVVINAVKAKLPNIIKKPRDFNETIKNLTTDQRAVVINAVKDQLPNIIKNAQNVNAVLENLTTEQRTDVIDILKNKLPEIIKKPFDYVSIHLNLTTEQQMVIKNAVKGRFPDLIRSADDFRPILVDLTTEERKDVINDAVKDRLPNIIKNASDFNKVIRYLTPQQTQEVCDVIKNKLTGGIITKNYHDLFYKALQELTPEQNEVVCNAVKNQLPNIIGCVGRFKYVINDLASEQITAVCNALSLNHWNKISPNINKFERLLKDLDQEKRSRLCSANIMQEYLPEKIKHIERDLPKLCDNICLNEDDKKQLLKQFFIGLVNKTEKVSMYSNDKENACYTRLKDAANNYFSNPTLTKEAYDAFKNICIEELHKISCEKKTGPVSRLKDALIKFLKVTAIILTFGAPVALSMAKSRSQTGLWKNRLFETKHGKAIDDISRAVKTSKFKSL